MEASKPPFQFKPEDFTMAIGLRQRQMETVAMLANIRLDELLKIHKLVPCTCKCQDAEALKKFKEKK